MQKLAINELPNVGEITTMVLHPCADSYLVEVRTRSDRYRLVDVNGTNLLVKKGDYVHAIMQGLTTKGDAIDAGELYIHEAPEGVH